MSHSSQKLEQSGVGLSSRKSSGQHVTAASNATRSHHLVRRMSKAEGLAAAKEEGEIAHPSARWKASKMNESDIAEASEAKGRPRRVVPRRGEEGKDPQAELSKRRERSDAIGARMQRRKTERIDMLSRQPLYNPRKCFEEARRLAQDAEVAAMVVATAQVALEQQKRREINVRRLKLRDSAVGENLAMQGQMAQLLAMRRQNEERATKRKCAETILRWAKCELNDCRLLKEGAVDAAARLALEDDDMTRKLSAAALRTLARRELFWEALLQPHVLSAIRELFNEEPCYQPAIESDSTSRPTSHGRHKSGKSQAEPNAQPATNAVARDAVLILSQLTSRVEVLTTDSIVWEERLAEKGIPFLLLHGAERHIGVAEAAALALYNLTCVEKPHSHMEKIIQALVQMPGISMKKVRTPIALALRNIGAHPSLILRMIEEGVVQRIGQLAIAALPKRAEHGVVDDTVRSSQSTSPSTPEDACEADDDTLREACMWMMLRFAQTYVVRLDMLHAGANRAIFALLRRSRSARPSVAIVAGWGAMTIALLAEAPGALDIMSSDKNADTSRSIAMAIEGATALDSDCDQAPVLASVRAATHAAISVAMITKSEVGRAMLMTSYFKTQKRLESVSFVDDDVGTCGAEDVLFFSLGSQAPLVKHRSSVIQTGTSQAEISTDSALQYFLITLAQLLGDFRHGSSVLAMTVKTGTLKNLTQMCCHREVAFPTELWTSSADIFSSTTVDPILLLDENSCGSLEEFVKSVASRSEKASCDGNASNGEDDATFHSASKEHDTSVKDFGVSMIPFSRQIIGPCALVFDRVSTFDSVWSNPSISRSLVPGIVSLSRRIHELIAAGWQEEETALKESAAINSPSWCLVSCAAALGQLASTLNSCAPVAESRSQSTAPALESPRVTSERNAVKTTVQTLEMLHGYATTRKTDSQFYVRGATRTLIALRRIALESGVVGDVATAVVPIALKWYRNGDHSAFAAVASLCAALSKDRGCRKTLLENGILPLLSECKAQYKSVHVDVSRDKAVRSSRRLDTVDLVDALGIDEIESVEDRTFDKIANLKDVESDGRLCCAVILANMSLDSDVRLCMVFEKAATALSALSDTSYCEKMQLACARALCNLCTTAAEQACKMTGQVTQSRPAPPSCTLASEIVMTLVDQKVVLPVAMIGAVRASRHSTRRFCAAALANLMAPCGQTGIEDMILKKADKQGLIPTLVRLCRVDDVSTRAFAACAIARISESTVGCDFLASRPLVLRALFSEITVELGQLNSLSELTRSNSMFVTVGHSSTKKLRVSDNFDGNGSKRSLTEEGAIILRQRSIVRIACRLIGSSTQYRSIAIQAGCLEQLTFMLTLPRMPELLVCMKAIKASAGDAKYRELIINDSRILHYLAIYANEASVGSQPSAIPFSDGAAREISIAAQGTVSLLIHDLKIRESVAKCEKLVYTLVAVALQHARREYDPIHSLTVAKCLLCILLAANTQQKLTTAIKLGVLTALVSLGTKHRAVYLAPVVDDKSFGAHPLEVIASFELSAVVMSALHVVSKQGAASGDIALTIRNERVVEMIAEVLSDEKALLAIEKITTSDSPLRKWLYSSHIRAHAVLYSFARYHESLRAKLSEVAIGAIRTVSLEAIKCETTAGIVRAWIVSTLSLLLADTAQRHALTENADMISNVIEIARNETAASTTLLQSHNVENSSTIPFAGTTVKNLTWCFYQASRVPRKKTRIALQDAIRLNAELAVSPYIAECPWLLAASKEAHRLLTSEQYEHTIMTQDGTLEQLVKISFRGSAEENEGGARILRKYEDFEFLAASLQPVDAKVQCEVHEAGLEDDSTLLSSVPEETNDIFACDGAGLGPTIQDFSPIDSTEHSQLVPAPHDVQVDAHDLAEKRQLTPKASKHTSASEFVPEDRHNLCTYWLQKSPIPSNLVEASNLDEDSLSSVLPYPDDGEEEDADDESQEDDGVVCSESDDSSRRSSASSSVDDEGDEAHLTLPKSMARRARHVVLRSEKLSVEDETEPPLYPKDDAQEFFLAAELSKIFFLKHLTRKEIRYLVSFMERTEIKAGSELSIRTRLYIVEQGSCEVYSPGGKLQVVPNEAHRHLGELSLLYDDDNSKTVATTKSEVVAFILDRKTFKYIMQANEKKKRTLYSQFLSNVPLFKDIDPEKRNHVCDALQPIDFNAGDVLIRQGERGDEFFILEEGSVECVQSDEDGVEKVIAPKVTAGAFFGELALLRDAPRAATVRALEDVSVVKIDRDTFHRAIGDLEGVHRDYEHSRSLVDLQEAERRRKRGNNAASHHDDESSDDDDDWDYVGFQPVRYSERRALKRDAVAAEPTRVHEDWVPPTYEKTDEERDFLCKELSQLFFLKLLDRHDVHNLVCAMHKVAFEPNDTLIRQGETSGDTCYIIQSGFCRVTMNGSMLYDLPDDLGAKISGGSARRHVGEFALLHDQPRDATVYALSDVEAWCLNRSTFTAILQAGAHKQRALYSLFLSKVPIFKKLDDNRKAIICDALKPKRYDDGQVLIREGDRGEDFFLVESGTVVVTTTRMKKTRALGEGQFFGERALLRDEPRTATVTALGSVSVLRIDRNTFDRVIETAVPDIHAVVYPDDELPSRAAGGEESDGQEIRRSRSPRKAKITSASGREAKKLRPGSLLSVEKRSSKAHRALLEKIMDGKLRQRANDARLTPISRRDPPSLSQQRQALDVPAAVAQTQKPQGRREGAPMLPGAAPPLFSF